MEYWLAHKDGKILEQVIVEDGDEPRWSFEDESATFIQVERHGDLSSEKFDFETRSWTPCPDYVKLAADLDAGADHIAFAHAVKTIEARLILAGTPIAGVVSAEAEALGLDVTDLAQTIVDKAQGFVDTEVNRRKAKEGVT